jgi:hypothetical protein
VRVASIIPGCWLTSATSLLVFAEFFTTVFGTGLALVGFDAITTRGGATVFPSPTRSVLRAGNPKLALPSVTGIGGKLDTSTDGPPPRFPLTDGATKLSPLVA